MFLYFPVFAPAHSLLLKRFIDPFQAASSYKLSFKFVAEVFSNYNTYGSDISSCQVPAG